MKLVIEIDYTGQRILSNNVNYPVFEVTVDSRTHLCLAIEDVTKCIDSYLHNNKELILPLTKDT